MSSASVLLLTDTPSALPVPTRDEVCGIRMHFRGGIVVESAQFGTMPWWPSALAWCDATTRQAVYAAMRVAGDTHALIDLPMGLPLYNEGGQFYSPDKFPALDWTNGLTTLDQRYDDLFDEIVEAGFHVLNIMGDERQEPSTKAIPLVMQRLIPQNRYERAVNIPGYDGVFYGWEPSGMVIPDWAASARQIIPDCYLGIEFNVGHIPLGEGDSDYLPGGRMKDFDLVLGEYPTGYPGVDDQNIFQIVGRLVKPYFPPPQDHNRQPPPFYLHDCARGPRYHCMFETWNPYDWVRVNMHDPAAIASAQTQIAHETAYFRNLGCQWTA